MYLHRVAHHRQPAPHARQRRRHARGVARRKEVVDAQEEGGQPSGLLQTAGVGSTGGEGQLWAGRWASQQ